MADTEARVEPGTCSKRWLWSLRNGMQAAASWFVRPSLRGHPPFKGHIHATLQNNGLEDKGESSDRSWQRVHFIVCMDHGWLVLIS